MSYILDALKKSEQERGAGSIPDVQTIHSSSLNYRNDKKAYWPYILIAAVILNLFAITYFIVNEDKTVEPQASNQNAPDAEQTTEKNMTIPAAVSEKKKMETTEPLPDAATTVEKKPALPETPVAKPASDEIQVQDKTVTDETNSDMSVTGTGTDTGSTVIEFHDLPESIKQQLPAIIISAHVYSSNPLQRSVVINNNFMEEGEYLLDGLILYKITADGAIFNYQGTLFNYGVVSGWQ